MGNLTFGALVRQDNGQGFRIRDDVIVIGRNYDCDLRIEKPVCVPGARRHLPGKRAPGPGRFGR